MSRATFSPISLPCTDSAITLCTDAMARLRHAFSYFAAALRLASSAEMTRSLRDCWGVMRPLSLSSLVTLSAGATSISSPFLCGFCIRIGSGASLPRIVLSILLPPTRSSGRSSRT
ncbi:hypothetical protein D9M68_986390 [compost metagenome]